MAKAKKETNEETGGELSNIPNDKYRKFFDKFTEIETLEVEQWKPVHLLAYFCKKYKETYDTNYAWKFNDPNPSKCFEVWQLSRIAANISANPKLIKDYIDWAYQNLVPKATRRFTSISFITKDYTMNNYKMNVLLSGKRNLSVSRTTTLPANYKAIFEEIGVFADNYGDLAFLSQMEQTPEMASAFQKLEQAGFDKDILERIV